MDEKVYLTELSTKPLHQRLRGYMRLTGPGYMQSAMTLGGGSIASCVLMGSILGYELLWVQPVAIFLGVCVLSAVAKQTTATGEDSYGVFWNRLHPLMAILWGVSSLVATILWHIPQYGLTANGAVVLGDVVGLNLDTLGGQITILGTQVSWGRIAIGVFVVPAACSILYLYTLGAKGLKIYERTVKILVWLIVLAFTVAAFASGIDFISLLKGITGISFVQRVVAEGGIPPSVLGPMVGALAAAVGINMIFLYPYSLLKKNWGKEHKELAYFDLVSGMAVPFFFATGFMMIAVANTIGPDGAELGTGVKDMREIIPVLEATLGSGLARLVIGLGMFAVGFSTIITHMLASGFIGCALFGLPYNGRAKLWFSLLPVVGVVGVAIKFPFYAAVTASLLAAPLMPVTVVGFLILMNMRSYLGDETPVGMKKVFWNGVLIISALTLTAGAWFSLKPKYDDLMQQWFPQEVDEGGNVAHAATGEKPTHQTFTNEAMGTRFEFLFPVPDQNAGDLGKSAAAQEAFDAIKRLEQRISSWDPASETSKLNRSAHLAPVKVSATLYGLLSQCRQVYNETGGAFDVTVGPLIDLYRNAAKHDKSPTPGEIESILKNVGFDKITLDADALSVAFARDGMRLDFGGIGKGVALDNAANILREQHIENFYLSGGTSTVLAMGTDNNGAPWVVDILNPLETEKADILAAVALHDEALSTSSLYRLAGDGKEHVVRHIFDPRTGRQTDHLISATVVAPTAAVSDALSTAFYVLGLEKAQVYCSAHPDIRAILVRDDAGTATTIRINFQA